MGLSIEQGSHKYLNVYLVDATGSPVTGLATTDVMVWIQKQGDTNLTEKILGTMGSPLVASIDGDSVVAYVQDSTVLPVDFGRIVFDAGTPSEEYFEVANNLTSGGRVTLEAVTQYQDVVAGTTEAPTIPDPTPNTTTTIKDVGAGYAVNEYAGNLLHIKSGAQDDQYRVIASNTAETITVTHALGSVPADLDGVLFEILKNSTATWTASPGTENNFIPLPSTFQFYTDELAGGWVISVVGGAGSGQRRKVLSNTVTSLQPSSPFSATNPVDDTSVFQIQPNRAHAVGVPVQLIDWREALNPLGNGFGVYSILFQGSELDTLDAFTYLIHNSVLNTTPFVPPAPYQVDIILPSAQTSQLAQNGIANKILKCRLTGSVATLTGTALEGIRIYARIVGAPQLISDIGLGTATVSAASNINGYFELLVARGSILDVTIPELNYRRTLTVPNQDVADLFLIP